MTRFVPIINHIDTAVYYQLCGEIGDRAIEDLDGVFWGWQVVPTPPALAYINSISKSERVARLYSQEYFSETFSSAAWLQNYLSFTECIGDATKTGEFGDFVGVTDVANFYDSIDIDKLVGKLRSKIPGMGQHFDLLQVYLNFWNRRIGGYQPSNKGIPQDIISDGSRNLSHFYLHDLDRVMIKYCRSIGGRYVRWADDILIFAPSRQRVESALYWASEALLRDGLNLSAPKASILSRSDFRRYRCIPLLEAINKNDDSEFTRQVHILKKNLTNKRPVKFDTAIRAVIGHLIRRPHLRTSSLLAFVEDSRGRHAVGERDDQKREPA